MSKDINGLIYCATNIVNGKQYVGQTRGKFKYRQSRHKKDSQEVDNKFYRAIRKHGWDSFIWYIIEDNIQTIEELNEREEYWIGIMDTFHDGYNSTTGGEGFIVCDEVIQKRSMSVRGENHFNFGKHLSKEVRSKISESLKGTKNPNFGKHLSEYTRKKLSEANQGRIVTDETRRKMRDNHADFSGKNHPRYGETCSAETRNKIGEANGKPVLQIDKITGQVVAEYRSARKAESVTGICNTTIGLCCKGKAKTTGGYIWRYKED